MSDRMPLLSTNLPPLVTVGSRYEIASLLGEGGMATVYRALDRESGEWCALKVLLAKYSERPNIRARFAAEAQAMSRIKHRNVIQVFDVGTADVRPYFAMELAQGGCLVDWVEAYGPMPPRMAADVAIQICKGIGAAHRLGVIHRDIKPHNILVNRRGVCKITDFGIAQFDDDAASLTQTGSVMGTLGYIAPEQRANAKDVDERTDVYSIGATLYTLLTARTTMDLFFADQEPEMLAGIAEPLVPVVLKATRYRREERYATVRAMAKALYHAKAALPEDPPDTPSIVMQGGAVEGSSLRAQRTTCEPAPARLLTPSTTGEDEPTAPTAPKAIFGRAFTETPAPVPRADLTPIPPGSREAEPEIYDPQPHARTPGPWSTGTPMQAMRRTPVPAPDRPRQPSMPPLPREALLSRPPVQKEPLIDWGRVVRRTVAITIPLLVLIFGASTYGAWGAAMVDTQRNNAFKSLAAFVQAVEREQGLYQEIEALGGTSDDMRRAIETLSSSKDPLARGRSAEAWLSAAQRELATHAPSSPSSRDFARAKEVQARLSRLDEMRAAHRRQRAEWQQATETVRGRFAVWLGFVTRPADHDS